MRFCPWCWACSISLLVNSSKGSPVAARQTPLKPCPDNMVALPACELRAVASARFCAMNGKRIRRPHLGACILRFTFLTGDVSCQLPVWPGQGCVDACWLLRVRNTVHTAGAAHLQETCCASLASTCKGAGGVGAGTGRVMCAGGRVALSLCHTLLVQQTPEEQGLPWICRVRGCSCVCVLKTLGCVCIDTILPLRLGVCGWNAYS